MYSFCECSLSCVCVWSAFVQYGQRSAAPVAERSQALCSDSRCPLLGLARPPLFEDEAYWPQEPEVPQEELPHEEDTCLTYHHLPDRPHGAHALHSRRSGAYDPAGPEWI